MQSFHVTIVDPANDVRIIGAITVTILLCIVLAGMEWEYKVSTFKTHFCRTLSFMLLIFQSPVLSKALIYQLE